ncbi:MAG: hypothetical protein Q4B15_07850 [Lachnospiraceae bacterium]|nr:hypothetical protein [Lachnospiraceae bacterium]
MLFYRSKHEETEYARRSLQVKPYEDRKPLIEEEDGKIHAEVRGFPEIEREASRCGYGGSQYWFRNKWSRLAGCASVSATNLIAFHGFGTQPDSMDGDIPVYEEEHYIELQNRMFGYMRPGMRGFPYIEVYEQKFLEYASTCGLQLNSEIYRGWKQAEDAFRYVQTAINENNPMAMLILTHRAAEIEEDTWHWMTITGYETAGEEALDGDRLGRVLISNYGKRQWMRASVLFEAVPGNDVKLILFRQKKTVRKEP